MTDGAHIAVISGASADIGRATAQAFARAGYRVALIARSQRGLMDTQTELQALGARTLAIAADVADSEAVERAAARIETELGAIDDWINSAMVTAYSPVSQLTAEEFRRVTEVTYLGVVHGTMAALRRMKERNPGTIVQIGSALSYRAIPLQSAYCGAKVAIHGFTDALRCGLIHEHSHVRLTMVQLPAHNTPQFDWAHNKTARRLQPVPPIHAP
jgi:short-subunit dehydrogenase